MSVKHLFAFDPGDKRNGFCWFKYDTESKIADLKIMSILDPEELNNMIKVIWGVKVARGDAEIDITLVCENFRVRPENKTAKFGWNELHVIRSIGKVELLASLLDCKLVLQEPSNVLAMGRKWVPFKVAAGHLRDDHAAFIHGAHYMMAMKWFPTVDSITMFGQEKM